MEILTFSYMRKALLVGLLLSTIIPLLGVVVVNKRLSLIGDALSHVSLAGVILGLVLNINPVLGAVMTAAIASLAIEGIRKKIPSYSELSIAIIMSTGIGLASILSSFVTGSANFESFLFGSIIAISNLEVILVCGISLVILASLIYFYQDLMYIAFDEVSADLAGVPVNIINTLFILMTGVTIALASRTVGVLIISSLMVIPVATAMQLEKSYKWTSILASLFGIFSTITGLVMSFYLGLKPGGTIVIIGVISLLVVFFITRKK